MAADTLLWHCPQFATAHSLYRNFGSSLAAISERDYPGENYFRIDIPAIDLDHYESELEGDNDCTVDAVIGICNLRQNKPSSERLLLVELRMNYRSTRNLSPTEIRRKDLHSRQLLYACPDTAAIDPTLCLVFHPDIEQQAISWSSRENRSHRDSAHWRAFTPASLCNHINAGRKPPYTPREETILAGKRFDAAASGNDVDALEAEFNNLRDYFHKCRQRYENGECDHLRSCVKTTVAKIRRDGFSEEDRLLLDIILGDLSAIMNITIQSTSDSL